MKLRNLPALALVVLGAATGPAGAQNPTPQQFSAPRPPSVLLPEDSRRESPAIDTQCEGSFDFLIGLPLGVRGQLDIGKGDASWVVEGVLGLEAFFPVGGGGVRRRWTLWSEGRNSFHISPGADVFVLSNSLFGFAGRPFNPFVTADVDVYWRHAMGSFESRLGVKLGVGYIFDSADSVLRTLIPVASVFIGFQF